MSLKNLGGAPSRSSRRRAALAFIIVLLVLSSVVYSWNANFLNKYYSEFTRASSLPAFSSSGSRTPEVGAASPACKPHFQLALPDGNWTQTRKFKRLYFYHVRKAGGTNLRNYFEKVARHHDLEWKVLEYHNAEEPGTHDEETFYVTHLREPVSRSISHFKYEGRWDCREIVSNHSFIPTDENTRTLETWNTTHGHSDRPNINCNRGIDGKPGFGMVYCAVNCLTQWFSGLSCSKKEEEGVPSAAWQYKVAREKLLRYNFIVISERLKDPEYVSAVERFFGVSGVDTTKHHPYCEPESHKLEERYPLVVKNETLDKLMQLNRVDLSLYHEMADCLEEGDYDFPSWDLHRFVNKSKEFE